MGSTGKGETIAEVEGRVQSDAASSLAKRRGTLRFSIVKIVKAETRRYACGRGTLLV